MLTRSEAKLQCAHYMWERAKDLTYKLDALQVSIHRTIKDLKAKKACVMSSRQIGKSYWDCTFAIEYLANHPNKIARIIAPTLKQCGDIVQDNLIPIALDAPPGFITPKTSTYRWELSNGSSLRLGAMERAHVDGNRGGNASVVIYEECGFVDADDFTYAVNSVLAPQLLRSNGMELFVTSPSENPDHPLHTLIYPACEELGTAFRYTVFDSPSITNDMIFEAMRRSGCLLTELFIQALFDSLINSANVHNYAEITGSVLSESFRREYLAEIIRPSSLMVVPGFDPHIHVRVFAKPMACSWTVTIDWGGVRDMTVALLHTYDFNTDTDLIWDERSFKPNTETDVIVKGKIENPDKKDTLRYWEDRYGGEFDVQHRWADVPGQLQVDLADPLRFDYPVMIPQKSDWKASVQNMATRFSLNKVLIHPRCKVLIKTLQSGMFNKTRTDFARSDTLGIGHCDALAALMYAIRSQDRTSPYDTARLPGDRYFVPKKETDIDQLAAIFSPKRFGNFKE